jgi:hypothetical protein
VIDHIGIESRWVWLLGSLVAAAAWANSAWYFRVKRPGPMGRTVSSLVRWSHAPLAYETLRLAYYVGVPFAALLWGGDAIVERLLGLPIGQWASGSAADTLPDLARDLGWTIASTAGALGVLTAGWLAYRRSLIDAGVQKRQNETHRPPWRLLREAAYLQAHWSFYRNAPSTALLLRGLDQYWGVWGGLALVAAEALLDPAWRNQLTEPRNAPSAIFGTVLAVLSTMLFLLTESLPMLVVFHFLVTWGLSEMVQAFPLAKPSRAQP